MRKARRAKVSYELYTNKLTINEAPKPNNKGKLFALYTYCGRYYYPTRDDVEKRLAALVGLIRFPELYSGLPTVL
jgi:hypothetical protein